jgi:hypothetical protein
MTSTRLETDRAERGPSNDAPTMVPPRDPDSASIRLARDPQAPKFRGFMPVQPRSRRLVVKVDGN